MLFILTMFTLGIAIPKLVFHDTADISAKEISCAKYAANRRVFDNAIEPWLIVKLVVSAKKQEIIAGDRIASNKRQKIASGKNQEVVYANAYTLFGIKYATVGAICNSRTGALISAGKSYNIWKRLGILDYLIEKPKKPKS